MRPIENEFSQRGVVRGEMLFLPPLVALDMVARCRELDIQVLGLDAFFLTEATVQPSMEHSIDLSHAAEEDADCWSAAEGFLRRHKDSELYFEVVVE